MGAEKPLNIGRWINIEARPTHGNRCDLVARGGNVGRAKSFPPVEDADLRFVFALPHNDFENLMGFGEIDNYLGKSYLGNQPQSNDFPQTTAPAGETAGGVTVTPTLKLTPESNWGD